MFMYDNKISKLLDELNPNDKQQKQNPNLLHSLRAKPSSGCIFDGECKTDPST